MKGKFLLAIDQGTSSSRTVIYDHDARVVASAQQEFPQIYPQPGWVEHDPEAIWESVTSVTRDAMHKAGAVAADISAIGITNQRETTLIWDRDTGECVYNAIVWQDRRTAAYCQALKDDGLEATVSNKTGLRLDPYFSGTKIAWILDNVDGVREKAEAGKLAFGTIDCFLLWRLTGGRVTPPMRPTRRARCCLIFIRRNGMRNCSRCSRFLVNSCPRCVTALRTLVSLPTTVSVVTYRFAA